MTYFKAVAVGKWYTGGENASAECAQVDECDWETGGYTTLREATRQAEAHVLETGHPVQVERAQFRILSRAER